MTGGNIGVAAVVLEKSGQISGQETTVKKYRRGQILPKEASFCTVLGTQLSLLTL